MALAYTKEFLVDALVSRYQSVHQGQTWYRKMAEKHYDEVGKDVFRVHASLDAEAIRKYKLELKAKI